MSRDKLGGRSASILGHEEDSLWWLETVVQREGGGNNSHLPLAPVLFFLRHQPVVEQPQRLVRPQPHHLLQGHGIQRAHSLVKCAHPP